MPSRVEHEDQAWSSIFDTLALFPSPSLIATVASDEGLTRAAALKAMSRSQTFPRSTWLEQLAREYVFAREANLFSDVSLPAIARHAFASPSTLLRHFRDDTGKTPHADIKTGRGATARAFGKDSVLGASGVTASHLCCQRDARGRLVRFPGGGRRLERGGAIHRGEDRAMKKKKAKTGRAKASRKRAAVKDLSTKKAHSIKIKGGKVNMQDF